MISNNNLLWRYYVRTGKQIFILLPLFCLCFSSCSNWLKYSKGYDHEIELSPIETAYYLEKDQFGYNEDVNVCISYGHNGVTNNIPDENKNLPFCLFLNYGKEDSESENDYRQYNGFELIEEVEPKKYKNDYLYSHDGYSSKRFNHTVDFTFLMIILNLFCL